MEQCQEGDVETKWNSMKNRYMAVRNECIQKKKVMLNRTEQPRWFSNVIVREIGENKKHIGSLSYIQHKKILEHTSNNAGRWME